MGLELYYLDRSDYDLQVFDDYCLVELAKSKLSGISVHLSTDFYHAWWHTANYPTYAKAEPSIKISLCFLIV